MDDSIDSVETDEIGVKLYHQLRSFWNKTGMQARNSNSKKVTQDEKTNLHKICLLQICCKYELFKALHPVQMWRWQICHRHLCTGCKALKIHICNRFAPCKFWANSIFHPVSWRKFQPKTKQRSSPSLTTKIQLSTLNKTAEETF